MQQVLKLSDDLNLNELYCASLFDSARQEVSFIPHHVYVPRILYGDGVLCIVILPSKVFCSSTGLHGLETHLREHNTNQISPQR